VSEPPRRRRLQIHLSTAVVMMITAGGMIGGNLTLQQSDIELRLPLTRADQEFIQELRNDPNRYRAEDYQLHARAITIRAYYHGWPTKIRSNSIIRITSDEGFFREIECDTETWESNIVLNAGAILCILFTLLFLCEQLIRRRAVRKGREY
jgi:hypothetical protein